MVYGVWLGLGLGLGLCVLAGCTSRIVNVLVIVESIPRDNVLVELPSYLVYGVWLGLGLGLGVLAGCTSRIVNVLDIVENIATKNNGRLLVFLQNYCLPIEQKKP